MNKKTIILLSALVAVLVMAFFAFKGGGFIDSFKKKPADSDTTSTVPPKCQLSGKIVFDGKVFVHAGSEEFTYQDVYDPFDIVRWQVSPSGESVKIGPSGFSGMTPVKGGSYLTVSFDDGEANAKYDEYKLTASMDYVAEFEDGARVLNVKCSGETVLVMRSR